MKGTIEIQKKDNLYCQNLDEANRIIRISHDEIVLHAQGKRFWMWMFISSALADPFFKFLDVMLKGLSE